MSTTSHAHRWLSGALSRVAQSISQPVCPTITGVRGSTTTGIVLLDRWTWHCSERAEHTAVALMRTQNRSTARALIEELTRCDGQDRKSTRLNSSHVKISYAVFCLK